MSMIKKRDGGIDVVKKKTLWYKNLKNITFVKIIYGVVPRNI